MATDEPATLYCRFIDSISNHRQLEHLDQFLTSEVVEHTPGQTIGIDAARRGLGRWLAAFPDLHLTIEDLVVDGDHLMARLAGDRHPPQLTGQPGRRPASRCVCRCSRRG